MLSDMQIQNLQDEAIVSALIGKFIEYNTLNKIALLHGNMIRLVPVEHRHLIDRRQIKAIIIRISSPNWKSLP